MPVSPYTISSTQKALCLYLVYLGTRPDKGGFRILDWGGGEKKYFVQSVKTNF